MISTFGCDNGLILAGARVFQTMAKDGMFFKSAVKNNKNEVRKMLSGCRESGLPSFV
jgi:APA family basic amino acid/polyamine antiporter